MAKHEMVGDFAALGGEKDVAATQDFHVAIAGQTLDGGGDSGRSDFELFGEAGADGHWMLFAHFPDGLELIFLRDAGVIPSQRISV